MPSFRSQMFLFFLTHRHWFRFKLKKTEIQNATTIQQLRIAGQTIARKFRPPAGIDILQAPLDHPASEYFNISSADDTRIILYFHGGGYVMGIDQAHKNILTKLVRGSGINALMFDYRLAPEHPFPAALDDALTVYKWVLSRQTDPAKIVFAGDSAGGGLALATLLYLRDHDVQLPAAAAVMSPWTDLKCTGASYNERDPLAMDGSWKTFGEYYAGDCDLADPLISPLYANLEGLPPLFIVAGEKENMRDDAVRLAEKAKAAGVAVTLKIGKGMIHCYPGLSPLFPEAKQAMSDMCGFLRASIGNT